MPKVVIPIMWVEVDLAKLGQLAILCPVTIFLLEHLYHACFFFEITLCSISSHCIIHLYFLKVRALLCARPDERQRVPLVVCDAGSSLLREEFANGCSPGLSGRGVAMARQETLFAECNRAMIRNRSSMEKIAGIVP